MKATSHLAPFLRGNFGTEPWELGSGLLVTFVEILVQKIHESSLTITRAKRRPCFSVCFYYMPFPLFVCYIPMAHSFPNLSAWTALAQKSNFSQPVYLARSQTCLSPRISCMLSHEHKFWYYIYFEFLYLCFTGTNDIQVKVTTVNP